MTVPGPGTYDNMATIRTPPGETSTAAGRVRIPNPDGSTDDDEPGIGVFNPTIVKQVNPPFAQPGDTLTWTILVINPHDQAITDVTVYDTLPDVLALLSTSTTNGTVTVNGQLVTLSIPTLNALETVTLTIRTRISPDSQEVEIRNLADLSMPNSGTIQSAEAIVLKVEELPATGEVPLHWVIMRGLLVMLSVGGIIGLTMRTMYRLGHRP